MTPGNRVTSGGRFRAMAFVLLLGAAAGGCSKAKSPTPPDPGPGPRLAPADVVNALQWAYRHRDAAVYGKLLADDFRFYFDPATRPDNVPEFWTRLQDSTATGGLFRAADVSDIRVTLTFGSDVPVNVAGQERWRKIRVTDTFLEVDKVPLTGEVITFRVDGDVQDFFVRKGRSPADTLAASPTAREWFLVEWRDLARLSVDAGHGIRATRPAANQANTWSNIKSLYR